MNLLVYTIIAMFALGGSSFSASASDSSASPRHPAFLERVSARNSMVNVQMRDVTDENVLRAMRTVPRHFFIPRELQISAYDDNALPIGLGQTISQPYIVAYMTQALNVSQGQRVLELGTGSGYQAAILAEIGAEVYSVEIVPELALRADSALKDLGYQNVQVKQGDGFLGWPEHAPYDRIIVTFAVPDSLPEVVAQLKSGGLMIMPVEAENGYQKITILRKDASGKVTSEQTKAVLFVPMTGKHAH